MSDNYTAIDGDENEITFASKDIGGVQFVKHITYDSAGAEVIPATAAGQASALAQLTAANTVLGAKTDAKSALTDATAISAMSVWKQISASVQSMAAALAGTLTVAAHAVTQGGSWVLSAGAAIIGQVGIDQTTDGLTNRVVVPFSRSLDIHSTLTPTGGGAYTSNAAIGATGGSAVLQIATGLASGTRVRVPLVSLAMPAANVSAPGTFNGNFFQSAPTAVNDNAVPTFSATDAAAFVTKIGGVVNNLVTLLQVQFAPAGDFTVDGAGKIYLIITCPTGPNLTTPGVATLRATVLY